MAAVLAAGVLGACACGGRLPAPTAADAARAQSTWKDTTVAELELGRHLYAERCSACHALYEPVRFSAARWPSLVSRMSARARLVSADGEAVTRYLVVMARAQSGAGGEARRNDVE
jgi:mono/diheme cytochrome c family protein